MDAHLHACDTYRDPRGVPDLRLILLWPVEAAKPLRASNTIATKKNVTATSGSIVAGFFGGPSSAT
jgi:hypothetical protein